MLYDCFLFYNELELLEIRLNELDGLVDKHVLVESTQTFQHKPKKLFFEENKSLFSKFLHKIVHVVVDDSPDTSTWDTEIFQRNAIARGLIDCKDDDLIMVSDVDEIPSPFAIQNYLASPAKHLRAFKMMFCYYFFNCQVNNNWGHARILPFCEFKKYDDVQKIREAAAEPLYRGGWHFSYLGGADKIVTKIQSFSHAELNQPYFCNKDRIEECMEEGIDFIMPRRLKFVSIDDKFPRYLVQNLHKFSHMIKKLGPKALQPETCVVE